MEFNTQSVRALQQLKTPALIVGVYSDKVLSAAADLLNHASNGEIAAVLKSEFKAAAGTSIVLRKLEGVIAERIVLVGLGKKEDYNLSTFKKAQIAVAQYCEQAGLSQAHSTLLHESCQSYSKEYLAQFAAMSLLNSTYQYDKTLSKKAPAKSLKKITFIINNSSEKNKLEPALAKGLAIANGMALARELGNLPANICTPSYLANQAKVLARQFKTIKVDVLERKQLETLKMGSFLSVAAGSDEPPKFIILKYTAPGAAKSKAAPIVLVGKGVTFDTGGISLKPGLGMDEMKYDMSGAGSVLGTFRSLGEIGLNRDVIGLIPATENMPNGHATKPGDVVTSMSGQTIEILNTDAEGRLILCDALTYAERFKPDAVIDIATLTGACVVALGHVNSGLYATDDVLAEQLLQAGKETLDTAWRMPLDDAYQDQLKSNFADMANIGGMPGGSVTAACFLQRFAKAYRWAHLDIAGTAWQKNGPDKGSSGRPVPLLVQFLLNQQA